MSVANFILSCFYSFWIEATATFAIRQCSLVFFSFIFLLFLFLYHKFFIIWYFHFQRQQRNKSSNNISTHSLSRQWSEMKCVFIGESARGWFLTLIFWQVYLHFISNLWWQHSFKITYVFENNNFNEE